MSFLPNSQSGRIRVLLRHSISRRVPIHGGSVPHQRMIGMLRLGRAARRVTGTSRQRTAGGYQEEKTWSFESWF